MLLSGGLANVASVVGGESLVNIEGWTATSLQPIQARLLGGFKLQEDPGGNSASSITDNGGIENVKTSH